MGRIATDQLAKLSTAMDGVAAVVERSELSSAAGAAHRDAVGPTRLSDAGRPSTRLGGEAGRAVPQGTIDEEWAVGGVVKAVGVTCAESKAKAIEDGASDIGRDGEVAIALDGLDDVRDPGRLEFCMPFAYALSEVLTSSR